MVAKNQIEGRNPVIEALKSGREIEKILVADGSNQGSIRKITAIAKEKGIVVQFVNKSKLDMMSDSKSHQGVVAIISAHIYRTIEYILDVAKSRNEDPFIIPDAGRETLGKGGVFHMHVFNWPPHTDKLPAPPVASHSIKFVIVLRQLQKIIKLIPVIKIGKSRGVRLPPAMTEI